MSDQAAPVALAKADIESLATQITDLAGTDEAFESIRDRVVALQSEGDGFYARYCRRVRGSGKLVYLPVEAFKLGDVTFGDRAPEEVFESSGTTGSARSRHLVGDRSLYQRSIVKSFRRFFGDSDTIVLGHLPGYVESGGRSSLVFMVDHLVSELGVGPSGLFVDDTTRLYEAVHYSKLHGIRIVLFGAAFGLLDLSEQLSLTLPPDAVVVETGGMKMRRREIARGVLHERLATAFGVKRRQIWSEYGMTELLSQAYATGDEWYSTPPWMRVEIVDPVDPERKLNDGEEGAIAIVDLANVYSACAVLTRDKGVKTDDRFKVLGRLPGVDDRGCNFLLE